MKPGNAGGAKGPQFKDQRTHGGKHRMIGDKPTNIDPVQKLCAAA